MQTGVVKFFNHERGYGFIKPDSGGRDLFAHIRQFHDGFEPRDGERVTFDTKESSRKPGEREAVDIRIAI